MNLLAIMAYGVYALLVGLNGNGRQMLDEASKDMGGFLPWIVSIGVIAVIWEIPATKKMAAPFLTLAVISFVLANWDTLRSQFNVIQNEAKS